MKFSNQTNADAGSPNPEAGAAKVSGAVKTYHGNPEWDEREKVSGKIYRAGRCEKTYRNQNGGFTAVFEKTPTQYQAADGSFQKIENELIRKDEEEGAVYCNRRRRTGGPTVPGRSFIWPFLNTSRASTIHTDLMRLLAG